MKKMQALKRTGSAVADIWNSPNLAICFIGTKTLTSLSLVLEESRK